MSEADRIRARLVETYRRKAKHYDLVSRLSPAPGYPQHRQRMLAVRALTLRTGDTVVDVACGTGLNFPAIEQAIGSTGRLIGVDLTDAMLERARARIEDHGWRNATLVQSDAAAFAFPAGVDAILSTYALTQVPDCAQVIAHGAAALAAGGHWAVLDLKIPDRLPGWLLRLGVAAVPTRASLGDWAERRPWEAIKAAVQHTLDAPSWTELCLGTAFLAVGARAGTRARASDRPIR